MTERPSTIPRPEYVVRMGHHKAQETIDRAETLGVPEGPSITLHHSPDDKLHFHLHFKNITAQKGWVIEKYQGLSTKVLIPAADVQDFTSIEENPATWIMRNTRPDARPAFPGKEDVTRVTLKRDMGDLRHVLGMVALSVMGVLALTAFIQGMTTVTGTYSKHHS